MKNSLLKIISFVGLTLTVVPSFFVWLGALPWSVHAILMAVGMVLWFGTAPFWMGKKKASS